MDHYPQHNSNEMQGVLGANYELPPGIRERMAELDKKDPDFLDWVLLRSREIVQFTGSDITVPKGLVLHRQILLSLIEAYDIRDNRDEIALLRTLHAQTTIASVDGGGAG